MTETRLKRIIRECIHEIMLEVRDSGLSPDEEEELEAYKAGYISQRDLSRNVKAFVDDEEERAHRRASDRESREKFVRKPREEESNTPARPKPTWSGKSVGEIGGYGESLKATGRLGFYDRPAPQPGKGIFKIKEKRIDPHWVWSFHRSIDDDLVKAAIARDLERPRSERKYDGMSRSEVKEKIISTLWITDTEFKKRFGH